MMNGSDHELKRGLSTEHSWLRPATRAENNSWSACTFWMYHPKSRSTLEFPPMNSVYGTRQYKYEVHDPEYECLAVYRVATVGS